MQKAKPETSLRIIKPMNLCCSNHSFRTHRMDLGLHSWKESSHFEVLPLGCLISPDLKALEIILKKKVRTFLRRIQIIHCSWNNQDKQPFLAVLASTA